MSNDVPPSSPGSPDSDPFAELLRGLINEPEPTAPAEPELPPTELMPAAPAASDEPDLPPTVSFPPAATYPQAEALEPTEPVRPFPPTAPTSADHPTAPTSAFQPTEATSVFAPTAATTAFAAPAATEQPTELLGGFGHVPPADTAGWSLADGEREPLDTRRKVVVGILIGVAALLVIAIAILLTNLVLGNGGAPAPSSSSSRTASGSPSPSATPSDSPTPSDTPVPAAAITSFAADSTTVQCPYDRTGTQQVILSWLTTNAVNVAIASSAAAVNDATQQPFENNLDASVTGFSIPYACSNAKWVYTLTVVGADGSTISQPIEVKAQYAAAPQPTPTPTPSPAPTFSSSTSAGPACAAGSTDQIQITVTWATTNATTVTYQVDDGSSAKTVDNPAGGSFTYSYQCTGTPHTATLTATGPGGSVTKTFPV